MAARISVVLLLATVTKNIQALAGTSFCTIVLLLAVSPYSLSALFCLLYRYADTMQSCLLTPFKCVNTKAIGLYTIILMACIEV